MLIIAQFGGMSMISLSIWQAEQNMNDLRGQMITMDDEAKDAAERVIDDLESLLELAKNFKYSIKE